MFFWQVFVHGPFTKGVEAFRISNSLQTRFSESTSGLVHLRRVSRAPLHSESEALFRCYQRNQPIVIAYPSLEPFLKDIAVVVADEDTDKEYGHFYDRSKYANLWTAVQRVLNRSNVRAVGYDIDFTPVPKGSVSELSDAIAASSATVVLARSANQVLDFMGRKRAIDSVFRELGFRNILLGMTRLALILGDGQELEHQRTELQIKQRWTLPKTVWKTATTYYQGDIQPPMALQMALVGKAILATRKIPIAIVKKYDEQAKCATYKLEDVASGKIRPEVFDGKFVFMGVHHRELDAHRNIFGEHVNGISELVIDLAVLLKLQVENLNSEHFEVEIEP